MELQICAVYDKKAELYDTPFMVRSLADAVRGFQQAAKNEQSNIYNYPEDFKLVHLGTFNNQTGEIKTTKEQTLIEAKSLVVKNTKKGK